MPQKRPRRDKRKTQGRRHKDHQSFVNIARFSEINDALSITCRDVKAARRGQGRDAVVSWLLRLRRLTVRATRVNATRGQTMPWLPIRARIADRTTGGAKIACRPEPALEPPAAGSGQGGVSATEPYIDKDAKPKQKQKDGHADTVPQPKLQGNAGSRPGHVQRRHRLNAGTAIGLIRRSLRAGKPPPARPVASGKGWACHVHAGRGNTRSAYAEHRTVCHPRRCGRSRRGGSRHSR